MSIFHPRADATFPEETKVVQYVGYSSYPLFEENKNFCPTIVTHFVVR